MNPPNDKLRTYAHVAPFAVFLVFLLVPELLNSVGWDATDESAPWYVAHPEHWIYPTQTFACLGTLLYFRKSYQFAPHKDWLLAATLGIVCIALWIAPGWLFRHFNADEGWYRYFGFTNRSAGFNPDDVRPFGIAVYSTAVMMRFVRLVIVVPLIEEIFWRGFLMRFITDPDGDFWNVPFGTHHRRALIGVTVLFVLAHSSVDFLPASIFGLGMYWITIRSKSLSACVLMHAVANLILGVYIMTTQQWGYW